MSIVTREGQLPKFIWIVGNEEKRLSSEPSSDSLKQNKKGRRTIQYENE